MMNKRLRFFLLVLMCLFSGYVDAQSPMQQLWTFNQNSYILDRVGPISEPSFAYSLRKVRRHYAGDAIRLRRSTDNAQADVAFDATGMVSANSNVTITVAGTSSLTIGAKMTLSAFKGTLQLFITIWYDQGNKAYHATQTTVAQQPELVLNTAGTGNTKPSLVFNGSRYLIVGKTLENLMNNGINSTFLLAMKVGANSGQYSFGYVLSNNSWRWSLHINWSDGKAYFDASEPCCSTSDRSFANGTSVNVWKQYAFIRGIGYKLVRRSNATVLDDPTAPSTARTGGDFWIGSTSGISAAGFNGSLTEVIMFPKDFSLTELAPIENDQIKFWNL